LQGLTELIFPDRDGRRSRVVFDSRLNLRSARAGQQHGSTCRVSKKPRHRSRALSRRLARRINGLGHAGPCKTFMIKLQVIGASQIQTNRV
jgi:hypothetical protein